MAQQFKLGYDHSAILVTDLPKSASFYSEILQLEEIAVPNNNPALRWFDVGNNRQLHLIKADKGMKFETKKGNHLSLHVDDFKAFVTFLTKKNIPYSDWLGTWNAIATRPDGVQQIYIQDPDGHWVEINDAKY